MYVLADACPLAQRGPIVEQNPHETKPAGCYHAARTGLRTGAWHSVDILQLIDNEAVDYVFGRVLV